MRSGAAILIAAVVAAAGGVVIAAATHDRDLAFASGPAPASVAVTMGPGSAICQRPIRAVAPFSRLSFRVGTHTVPGPPTVISVRSAPSGRMIAAGALPAGARDLSTQEVALDREIPARGFISVCFRNAGRSNLSIFGGPFQRPPALKPPRVGDQPIARKGIALHFYTDHQQTLLAMVPDIFARAALFKTPWTGAWVFWLLAALLVIGVPLLLARALRALPDDG